MPSSETKNAETNFREAFERLKAGTPELLPQGTPVSQNNVSREAGCDPTALKKSRFPALVDEIQTYIASQGCEKPPSERQRLLKQRQQSRNSRELIADLRMQRDAAASLLVEANAQIGILTRRLRDMEARLEDLQAKASILPLPTAKPKAIPRVIV